LSALKDRSSRRKTARSRASRAPSAAVRSQAERIVDGYRIIVERAGDGFVGASAELPGVFGDGETPEECITSTRNSLLGAVVTMLERNERPPIRGLRTAQVNVRLTADEKLSLSDAARDLGFRGVSEFLRAAALEWSTVRARDQRISRN